MNKSTEHTLNPPGMIGQSEPFTRMQESIKQVAPTSITVLLTGESGTGKEVAAKTLHQLSPRRGHPLVTVNCGAIPEGILESELFGHEKGSFTGAVESRKGYFEQADKGTLLLDEIGDMPLPTQVKLLRVLEERSFLRVGGSQMIEVNVRVLAATNKDLENAVQRGEFRKDLYYRLSAVKIHIPSLRERREDIPLLAKHFAAEIARDNAIDFGGFTEDGLAFLTNQSWPGNIRELKNILERIIILEKGKVIDQADLEKHMGTGTAGETLLPIPLYKSPEQAERELIYRTLLDMRMDINEIRAFLMRKSPIPSYSGINGSIPAEISDESADFSIKTHERELILKALDYFEGNRKQAAKSLGIGERTLYRKLKEYGID